MYQASTHGSTFARTSNMCVDLMASISWLVAFVSLALLLKAERLLSEMLDAGLTPNVVTYTSLMVVLRRGGQHEKCIKILDLMKSEVIPRLHLEIMQAGRQAGRQAVKTG